MCRLKAQDVLLKDPALYSVFLSVHLQRFGVLLLELTCNVCISVSLTRSKL